MALLSQTNVQRCACLALTVPLAGAPSAFAQTSPRYPSLSGVASSGTEGDGGAVLLKLTEAYDQHLLGDADTPIQPALQAGGYFTELSADVNYRAGGRRVRFTSTAGTTLRYYQERRRLLGIGHHVGAGESINLSSSTSLALNQTFAYTPSYLYQLFASVAPPEPGEVNVASNYAVSDNPSYNYGTSVALTERLGPRNSLTLQADGRYTEYLHAIQAAAGTVGVRNLLSYDASGAFVHGVSRGLRLNFGYAFKRAQYYTGVFPTEHDVNIGLEYERPLSRTRKTYLKLNTASILLQAVVPGDALGALRPQYRFVGDFALNRQLGRTWLAEGGYHRGVGFIEGIPTPVLTDGLTLRTSGLVSSRVSLSLTGAYSVGEPTISNASHGLTTYTASAHTSMALTRQWAVYVEYLYYFYDFSQFLVPVGTPPRVARNSARVGLTLWLPMGRRQAAAGENPPRP